MYAEINVLDAAVFEEASTCVGGTLCNRYCSSQSDALLWHIVAGFILYISHCQFHTNVLCDCLSVDSQYARPQVRSSKS